MPPLEVSPSPIKTKPDACLLEVAHLAVSFVAPGEKPIPALHAVDFTIKEKQTLALVGESGCGKSVTALSIPQLLPSNSARYAQKSSIRFQGEELIRAPLSVLRVIRGQKIGIIFQEPMASLNPLHSIAKQLAEALTLHNIKMQRSEIKDRVVALLKRVGIPHDKQRLNALPHQFSGGQRQRIMIAMAIANKPDLLIADEPTTALDMTTQAQILNLLLELQQDFNMALLLITHDLSVVRKMADDILIMNTGRIVERARTQSFFNAPQSSYGQQLLANEILAPMTPKPQTQEKILSIKNLCARYQIRRGFWKNEKSSIQALDGVSFELASGQTLGIVGESGSGKTTLALALLRLIKSEGDKTFLGKTIHNYSAQQFRPLRQKMQIVFQDPYGSLSPRMTVEQIISEGINVFEKPKKASKSIFLQERYEKIVRCLQNVGLEPDILNRYPHEFSGGQRQRIAIARALAVKPLLLILDEPTSALDMSTQKKIIKLLIELQKQYQLSYIFISHNLKVIRALADYVIVLQNGVVVESASASRIFENPKHRYTQELLDATLL